MAGITAAGRKQITYSEDPDKVEQIDLATIDLSLIMGRQVSRSELMRWLTSTALAELGRTTTEALRQQF